MRIGQLSERTGVAIPTIKYYLREGLLEPGERTSPNQASYGEPHVRRLRLIRALIEVGGLSVAKVGEVLSTLDQPDTPVGQVLGVVAKSVDHAPQHAEDAAWTAARARVDALIEQRGWHVSPHTAALDTLTGVLVSATALGHDWLGDAIGTIYADVCEQLAEAEVRHVIGLGSQEEIAYGVVVGTVLGETAIGALRRLAHQHVTAKLAGASPSP